jgi:hypothetical protein
MSVSADQVQVTAGVDNTSPVEFTVRGEPAKVDPGATSRST